jgi:hypothetical protein
MNNDAMKKRKAAETLVKYSWLRDHKAFLKTDCEIGVIDWETINDFDWQWSFQQQIMIEVFKFLLLEESNVSLDDLMTLNPMDRQAVIMALNVKFSINELTENLV